VASFDVSSYCALATYDVQLATSCTQLTAKATINPLPPAGSTVTYYLYQGNTQVSSNTTGNFSGLTLETNYTVRVIVNQECSGIQTTKDFMIRGPLLSIDKTDACGGNGKITINATGGVLPYTYSLDGGTSQTTNIFSSLDPGNFSITVSDVNSCVSTTPVTIVAGTNCVRATASIIDETCGLQNGTITVNATQGLPPYKYSLDGTNYQTGNVFTGLLGGNYTVRVKDATDGFFSMNVTLVTISVNPPLFTYITTQGTCGNIDGSIQLSGSAGVPPYTYSIGGSFQTNNVFAAGGGDYTVTIKDAAGCSSSQPVTVPQLNDLVTDAGIDPEICEGESVVLNATSNAVNFSWTPTAGISNTHILKPTASPVVTTKYYVKGTKGTCESLDSIIVNVKPAPRPFAGLDTTICFGQSVQLHASGGLNYTWTPATYLTNTSIPDPVVIKPPATMSYSLSAIGSNGCASLTSDQVKINVVYRLKIFAGNDTAVIVNEPLQLNAVDRNGNSNILWTWTPPAQLSNPNISNPVFYSDHDMRYRLLAATPDGCEGTDSLVIKVYVRAEIFVPTAFSPNGDGLNDVLKAIPVGMKSFNYFRIYNRWGEMVFSTTDPNRGWDGRVGGKEQKSEVFIWVASGVSYKGRLMETKGTVLLVR
jgi:gliding motility-associated-like protein